MDPRQYQGKQLDDLAIVQYTSHLTKFVGHLRQGSKIGNMLRIQMDQHQQLLGISKHFLTVFCASYPYIEPSRMQFLWEKNTKYGITLMVTEAWNQKVQRSNDVFLMDKICETIKDTETLVRINNVRLWLKVSRLSDIASADGKHIEHWAMHGRRLQI